MNAAGFAMVALAIFIGYEAFQHFKAVTASAAGSSTPGSVPPIAAGAGSPAASIGSSGLIPNSWLRGLAKSESPSALQGNYQYGIFGLSAGSTPGIGYPGQTSYSSQDPNGGTFAPQIYQSWDQGLQGLTQWINQHAPSAWGYAQSGNCVGFFQALQAGGYGGNAGWPSNICGLAS